jgi:hypothetical protein
MLGDRDVSCSCFADKLRFLSFREEACGRDILSVGACCSGEVASVRVKKRAAVTSGDM